MYMWLCIYIYCAYAAQSWTKGRMLMSVIYKLKIDSLHVEKEGK